MRTKATRAAVHLGFRSVCFVTSLHLSLGNRASNGDRAGDDGCARGSAPEERVRPDAVAAGSDECASAVLRAGIHLHDWKILTESTPAASGRQGRKPGTVLEPPLPNEAPKTPRG